MEVLPVLGVHKLIARAEAGEENLTPPVDTVEKLSGFTTLDSLGA